MPRTDMSRHITWIASYPKSGNTWLRFIVFWLAHRRLPDSSPELDNFASSRLPAYIKDAPEFCRAVKAKPYDADIDAPIFVKTHACADAVRPLLGRTHKAIYICRHPLDVMQSALNYARLNGEIEPGGDPAEWIDAYLAHGGDPRWAGPEFAAGDWAGNIASWHSMRETAVLLLRYEDLIGGAEAVIVQLGAFLDIPLTRVEAVDCAQATSFEALRQFEQKELAEAKLSGRKQGRYSTVPRLRASTAGVHFFNRGTIGSFRQAFTDDQIERAWRRFSPSAVPLGYRLD